MKRTGKYLLSALLITTTVSFSSAQIQWQKEYIYSNHAVNNTVETARTTIETADGGYLIGGIAEKSPRMPYVAKLNANGDSLWTRYYGPSYGNFSNLTRLYRDNDNKLYGAFETGYGRLTFVELNENNGDTLSSFFGPMGPASGYGYMAHTQLPNGDYILSYTQNSSLACIVKRFTPGSLTAIWSHDYAGEVIGITSIIQDGSDVVMSGYCGADWWQSNLAVTKLASSDGTVHWTKRYVRNAVWHDQKVGLVKNNAGNYLVAAGWTHNGKVTPSVLRVASNGDSLSISFLDTHAGMDINFGFCDDLIPFANGFVAAGEIDQDFDDAIGDQQNVAQMALFCINDNGQILNVYTMNQVGPYYNGSIYTGSYSWGLACIATSDNQVLVTGKGNYLAESGGWNSAFGDAYVVKISPETLGLNEHSAFTGLTAWPNPSNGKVQITASEMIERIVVYNQLGGIVFEGKPESNLVEIDLSETPGIYFYQGSGSSNQGSGKLIIR